MPLPGLDDAAPRAVATPFGTALVSEGAFAGVQVLHVSRHGEGHRRLSSGVTHQANLAALRDLGADAILAATVCGSLDAQLELGSLLVFDDLHFPANRLPDGSLCTLHAEPGDPGPRALDLRRAVRRAAARGAARRARETGHPVRDRGTYGHVDGPRFNTRSEIAALAAAGVMAVSQTAGPGDRPRRGGGHPLRAARLRDRLRQWDPARRPHAGGRSRPPVEASTDAFARTDDAALPRLEGARLEPVGTHLAWP